jgi:hypothetical protein
MQFYSKVVCQPESVNDFCGHSMRMPLSWNGVYGLSGGSYSGGFSEVTVTASGSYELIKSCADGCSSGSYTGTIEVRPGEIVHFNFDASAYSQNGGLGVATTDPYFYLSPADVADGYSLIFSEFVGNVPPGSGSGVPEPPSLMLFGAGVIAIGIAMRRRRSLKTSRA